MAERPEYSAILGGDRAAMAELGIERVALALVELFEGQTPEEFEEHARDFIMTANHPKIGAPYARAIYQPMLELLDLLRAHGFATFIVSGGGTEFVRAVSRELYGVDPEDVVGTLVAYEFVRRDETPVLLRTARVYGEANEGPAKVSHIRTQLGRRPIFAAGNSAGDKEMLEYAVAAPCAGLALLVDHDDSDREYAYASEAGTFSAAEPILETAQRLEWTVASMKNDWATVFAV
jgi:phosphoserine phosphatase